MGSNSCGDGETIGSTAGDPNKPIKKKDRYEPWLK
jgi:hypothetical protein